MWGMEHHSGSPALQDYISLFPVEDMQPSKLMRLLSSNEDDANILSSPSEHMGGLKLFCLGSCKSPILPAPSDRYPAVPLTHCSTFLLSPKTCPAA
jgi:hypothetical protein